MFMVQFSTMAQKQVEEHKELCRLEDKYRARYLDYEDKTCKASHFVSCFEDMEQSYCNLQSFIWEAPPETLLRSGHAPQTLKELVETLIMSPTHLIALRLTLRTKGERKRLTPIHHLSRW